MQISTSARHCEIVPELRAFAVDRLERCAKLAPDLRDVRLIVTGEKFRHTAEILARLNQHEMASREEAPDMRIAIDRAIDGLEAQLRKVKSRRLDRKREGRGPAPEADGPDTAREEIGD